MPWSHSLVMTMVWSALAFALVRFLRRGTRDGLLVAALVFSHWVLDVLTHRPDVPLAFGEARLGLGLWNSVPGTLLAEGGMWVGAILIYARDTESRDWIGSLGWWLLIGLMSCVYLASAFGPKPPEDTPAAVIAGATLGLVLFCAWGCWVDRHRRPSPAVTSVVASD